MSTNTRPATKSRADADRRRFIAACGKFAVVTPPAVTLLLSTSLHSAAIAASTGNNKGNNGFGNGGNDGSNADKQDVTR